MKIGRYIYRGRGGRKKGYVPEYIPKQKIEVKMNKPTKRKPVKIGIGKSNGDKFFMMFDEMYRILYIDLKIISGACGMMK